MSIDHYTINCGNTRATIGLFNGATLVEVLTPENFIESLKDQLDPDVEATICSTRDYDFINELTLTNVRKLPKRTEHDFGKSYLGMPVNYSETLGEDRLIGSLFLYDKLLGDQSSPFQLANNLNEVVFIDAGTFITVDLISKSKGLIGGHIFPGLELLKNTYQDGQNLHPPTLKSVNYQSLPTDTDTALSQALTKIIHFILTFMGKEKSYFLTGGSFQELRPLMEGIKYHCEPNIMHNAIRHAAEKIRH